MSYFKFLSVHEHSSGWTQLLVARITSPGSSIWFLGPRLCAPNERAVVRILRDRWCSRNHGEGGLVTEWCEGSIIFSASCVQINPTCAVGWQVKEVNLEVYHLGTNMLFPGCTCVRLFGDCQGNWRCWALNLQYSSNIIQYILQCRTSIPTKKTR